MMRGELNCKATLHKPRQHNAKIENKENEGINK